jgi:DNA-binding protein
VNLNFSDFGNKYTSSSLHDEKENVLAELTRFIQATDRVAVKSQSPNFSEALDRLKTIHDKIDTASAEATSKRIFNCR